MPIDKQKIKEQLEKITGNRLFNKSPRYINLITFLVEEALKGNDLKENVIGMEVFKEDYTSAKNDGLVRVYMYNLRKKLDTYYSGEGKNDPIAFVLEKGSYQLKFVRNLPSENVENKKKKKTRPSKQLLISTFTCVLILCFVGYFFSTKRNLFLWDSFFDKNNTNICILADQVVMHKKGANTGEFVTNLEVNSTDDFIHHIEKNNVDSLQKADFTFHTKAIPHSVYRLSRWFFKYKSGFVSISESEFRYEESKRNNIIYVGQQKTMSVSKELFLRNSKVFRTKKNFFTTIKDGEEILFRPGFGDGLLYEYAMVSFIPLINGKKAIYFVSNNDIGTMAVVNNFTDPSFLKSFYQKLPSRDAYFNALFKVEGVDRTDVNCEMVELEVIE